MTHDPYFQRAIRLAARGRGKTSPNPMVGAVLLKSGKIISEGWHRRCGADHAEVVVIKKAGRRARGSTLYVTLEPCAHYGRTPPCVDRIIASGIKKVLIGMKDPNPKTNGRSIVKFRKAGIAVESGFMAGEIKRLNEPFIKYITQKMPFVTAKCAQTIDGKVATAKGQSKWITSQKARDYARKRRDEFDAIVVGINTVLKDDPLLSGASRSKHLKKIIVDSSLRIPEKARLLQQTSPQDVIIATTHKADRRKHRRLNARNVQVLTCPVVHGRVDLKKLFRELAKREITNVLLEGGPELIGNALNNRLVDKFMIYIAPKIMGDAGAVSSVIGADIQNVNRCLKLKDFTVKKIGEDLLIEAYVHRNH